MLGAKMFRTDGFYLNLIKLEVFKIEFINISSKTTYYVTRRILCVILT